MRVLFVSSGNSAEGLSIIVKNQGESLIRKGIEVHNFTIQGKGSRGYIKNIIKLRKHLRNNCYDIIHAHYSLSGFVASIAGAKPLVVSLMGSDTFSIYPLNKLIWVFTFFHGKK